MKRLDLEHIIRAASGITRRTDFNILGSQALLASHPDAPADLLVSVEVDLYPRDHPDDSILIDGAIGEASIFHDTFGYYAHGVGPETATLPRGWEGRLVPIRSENTGGATGWCLEVHDLAASKLVAGRPKDLEFVGALVRHRLVEAKVIEERIAATPIDPEILELCRSRLRRLRGV